jgi:hypothetical protein
MDMGAIALAVVGALAPSGLNVNNNNDTNDNNS